MLIFAREKTIKAESPIYPSVAVDEIVMLGGMLRSGISATIDISFNNALTDASPLILIDPSELHQIMTNLMVNAHDAIEEAQLDRPGDGKIEVSLISIHSRNQTTYIAMPVRIDCKATMWLSV
jgi:signal transduction histidine kinase